MTCIKLSQLKPGATFNTTFGLLTITFADHKGYDARIEGRGGVHFDKSDLKPWLNCHKTK